MVFKDFAGKFICDFIAVFNHLADINVLDWVVVGTKLEITSYRIKLGFLQ